MFISCGTPGHEDLFTVKLYSIPSYEASTESSVSAGDVRSHVRLQMLLLSLRRGLISVDDQLHFWPSNSSKAVHRHGTRLRFHEQSWFTSAPGQMVLDARTLTPRVNVSGADRMSTFDTSGVA